MKVRVYRKDSSEDLPDFYQLSIGTQEGKVWINNPSGEGGNFDVDEVSDVLYEAIHAYFKKNL